MTTPAEIYQKVLLVEVHDQMHCSSLNVYLI